MSFFCRKKIICAAKIVVFVSQMYFFTEGNFTMSVNFQRACFLNFKKLSMVNRKIVKKKEFEKSQKFATMWSRILTERKINF